MFWMDLSSFSPAIFSRSFSRSVPSSNFTNSSTKFCTSSRMANTRRLRSGTLRQSEGRNGLGANARKGALNQPSAGVHSDFGNSDFFRHSDFELRISCSMPVRLHRLDIRFAVHEHFLDVRAAGFGHGGLHGQLA